MPAILSYVNIFSFSMLAVFAANATGAPVNPQRSSVSVVHDSSNTTGVQAPSHEQFYVQAGTFRSKKRADHYKRQLAKKFHQPVQVKKQGKFHVVVVGPMHSAAEVRALGRIAAVSAPRVQPVQEVVLEPIAASTDHFDFNGSLGVANLRTGDGLVGVTSDETDTLVQTNRNQWDTFAAQLGVGYVHYLGDAQPYSDQVQWFPAVEPQVNVYYLGNTSAIEGDVWRFGSSAFNQLTFEASVQSIRLMFDTSLKVVSRKQVSLYGIGGIGNAWNRMRYKDRDNEPGDACPNEILNLNSNTHSNFAWEAGGGLMYTYSDRVAFTLQYLYADLGLIRSSASGTSGAITAPVIVPPRFDLSAQTASFGLHIAV